LLLTGHVLLLTGHAGGGVLDYPLGLPGPYR
jgi:hypothetical protein